MSDIEMTVYDGVCRYCGTIQPIMALDQIDADRKISQECSCGGAELEKRKKNLLRNLSETIGKDDAAMGLQRVTPAQEEIITENAMQVFHGVLNSVTCKIDSSTITINRVGEKVKIKRVDTKSRQLEA